MKYLLLLLTLCILSGCFSHASSITNEEKMIQPTPTIIDSNANNASQYSYKEYKLDQTKLDELDNANEKFRQVPDEFKLVDFKNFKYDFGRLKNGEYEDFDPDKPTAGAQRYSFSDVFYIDLIGDSKKEAIVFIYEVSCGVSCDGGADVIYFFSSNKGKPHLLDFLETGSNSGGCSLKSFTVKEKKFYVEQFGKCDKNTSYDERGSFACKFCTKDETHSVYSFSNENLKRESFEIIETEQLNVMNSPPLISINE